MLPQFLSDHTLRLLLFGGKGGVGKTSCATATAFHLAQSFPESQFLLLSTDPAHSLTDSLADSVLPVNLKSQEIDTQECLTKFQFQHREKLREIAMRGTFLDNDDISQFLNLSLPGMDELIAFLEISRWVENGNYHCIIVDTAPAGHTMRLLQMPALLRNWLYALDALLAKHRYMSKLYAGVYHPNNLDQFLQEMATSLKHMEELLGDSGRCSFVLVTLAETVVIEETIAVAEELKKLKITIRDIIVNRLYPENDCVMCKAVRSHQMRKLSQVGRELFFYVLWGVPMYPEEIRGQEALEKFWNNAVTLEKPEMENPEWKLQSPETELLVSAPAKFPSDEIKLLLFAGKGGVGKTTLSCATAVHLAQQGKKVFLFSTDPAHSLSACLEVEVGEKPMCVMPGLTAMEINAQAEFDELKTQYIEELQKFLATILPNVDLTFDRQAMEKLIDLSPPGLDEVMALTRVMELLSQNKHDVFILDSAPTGHLIRLLELPAIMDEWIKVFFSILLKYKNIFRLPKISHRLVAMSKSLKQLRALLRDASKSSVYSVSISTEMAWEETKDLVAACERMEVNVPVLFLNLATPDSLCHLCSALRRREEIVRQKFYHNFPDKHHTLVYRQDEPQGLAKLTTLGQLLYQQ